MELQTNSALKVNTPKVKSVTGHPKMDEILICLFNGEVRLYSSTSLKLTRCLKITESSLRTGVMIPSHDWILVGTDEGSILILDLEKLTIINKIQAHDDFIRKIVVDDINQRFITVSDDNTAKLWSYKNEIVLLHCYKDSKHFVMDACFYPGDHSLFLTVSLDCKIRLYSVQHEKVIRKFKGHERGVNCIAFISSEIFVTGSDDHSIIVWDYKKGIPLINLKGHTGNVNHLYHVGKGFASCSEDNTVRIWDESFKTIDIKHTQGRAWCSFEKNGKFFIGSDEELTVYNEKKTEKIAILADNKVYFNDCDVLKSAKADELMASKEIGELNPGYKSFLITENGKFLSVLYEGKFEIFSTLGMRKKIESVGESFTFIGNDYFSFKNGENLMIYNKFEKEISVKIPAFSDILFIDENIVVINKEKTCVIGRSSLDDFNDEIIEDSAILYEFDLKYKIAFCFGDYLVLACEKIQFYNSDFEKIAELEHNIKSWYIKDNILYFSTERMTFYCFFAKEKLYTYPIKYFNQLVGIKDSNLIYINTKLDTYKLDFKYYNFQFAVLSGDKISIQDSMIDKAISFYESLGMHEQALDLCKDENQKFEILLKLNRLDEALPMANSQIKYKKLGKAFLKIEMFDKAADCFYKAGDMSSLLLVDVFGEKKYLKYIGETTRDNGAKNLSFLAFYKNEDYESCKILLKDTPFGNLFNEFYCHN